MSEEEVRKGLPPTAMSSPLIGVTPNPATTLSYPISYPATQPNASYERSHLGGLLPIKPHYSSSTLGTRYDPVRHKDPSVPRKTSPIVMPNAAEEGQSQLLPITTKRKRGEGPVGPADSYHSPKSQDEYEYEPQKLVTPTNSLQSGKRNHVCDLCGATFTRQHNLKSHFLTHTSLKKEFICTACGSEFRRSHDLKRHQKLHTGEKPFACNNCGRKFARADALGRHIKSSGEGGCVNSRKSSNDSSNPPHGVIYQLPTPIMGQERKDHFGSSGGDDHTRRSSLGSILEPERHDLSPRLQSHDQGSHQTFEPRGRYDPADNMFHRNPAHAEQPVSSNHTLQPHATLPPLQTGFSFDHERQSANHQAPSDSYIHSASFGLSPAFDGSRPPATHPLSYDRGSLPDSASSANTTFSHAGTVPFSQFQQLEARHREVEERLRQLESTSSANRSTQEGPNPTQSSGPSFA